MQGTASYDYRPPKHPPLRRRRPEEQGEGREIYSIIEVYSGPRPFQIRVVGYNALIEIGAAIKGAHTDYGNAYDNVWNGTSRHMIRDRDRIYGAIVTRRLAPWASEMSQLRQPRPGGTVLPNG